MTKTMSRKRKRTTRTSAHRVLALLLPSLLASGCVGKAPPPRWKPPPPPTLAKPVDPPQAPDQAGTPDPGAPGVHPATVDAGG